MASDTPLLFVPVGDNKARPFGMDAAERACRLAANAGFECAATPQPGRAALLASMGYGWDPAWLREMRKRPGAVLTLGDTPVMAPRFGRTRTRPSRTQTQVPVDPAMTARVLPVTRTVASGVVIARREPPKCLPVVSRS